VQVVEHKPHDQGAVYFGASVEVEDAAGTQINYRIVGPDETDAEQNWISFDSPLARALLKKRADDDVVVQTPGGKRELCILRVYYAD
jgi:transcription elongation factor GreB